MNLAKSELILMRRVLNVEELAFELGCKVGTLPTTYLDLKFAAIYNSMMVSNGIERKASEEGGNVETPIHIQEG